MIMFWVLLRQDRLANARQLESEHFGNCEKDSASAMSANGGLCPLDTHEPFKKGSILNFYDRFRKSFWKISLFFILKFYRKGSIDFGVQPFKKGLVGVERAKPSACTQQPRFAGFSRLKKCSDSGCSAKQNPKYTPEKSFRKAHFSV